MRIKFINIFKNNYWVSPTISSMAKTYKLMGIVNEIGCCFRYRGPRMLLQEGFI